MGQHIQKFIDTFNVGFEQSFKEVVDNDNFRKSKFDEAFAITIPKTGTWPKETTTIGDIFKYLFKSYDYNFSQQELLYFEPNSNNVDGQTRYWFGNTEITKEDFDGYKKDIKENETIITNSGFFNGKKVNEIYQTLRSIRNGGSSRREVLEKFKKPGVTNPDKYSPGQYWFDAFMNAVRLSFGPLKNEDSQFYKVYKGAGLEPTISNFEIDGLEFINDGSVDKEFSISNVKKGERKSGYFVFKSFILDYDDRGWLENYMSGVGFTLGIGQRDDDTTPTGSFKDLYIQYATGQLDELKKEPKFNPLRGTLIGTEEDAKRSGKPIGYFNGNFEHILLFRAFVEAGDNYQTVVLPKYEPPKAETPVNNDPMTINNPTTNIVTFNVEKPDTFVGTIGTQSVTFVIVKPDASTNVTNPTSTSESPSTDEFELLGEEYMEEDFAGNEELKAQYQDYIAKIESESGRQLTDEEKKEIEKDIKNYKPGKKSKTPPPDVIQAMKDYGINDPLEQAHFLAQCAHESGQFQWKREFASGKAYEGRSDLGNTQPGDGVRYKGRGYIQITGRANYTAYNKYLKSKGKNDDVVANPELLEGKYAADCSVWFWSILGPQGVKNFPKKAKEGATDAVVTKISRWVNGGDNGLADRKEKFKYYWGILENDGKAYS